MNRIGSLTRALGGYSAGSRGLMNQLRAGSSGGLLGARQRTFLMPERTFFLSSWRKANATASASASSENRNDYDWVSPEAQVLIAKAYARHKQLADTGKAYPPGLSVEDMEKGLSEPIHFEPKTTMDHIAYNVMRFLRRFTHAFFRKKYDHHAVVLETVAAVPGIVAAMHRHLRSLRRMERDHGWINPLLEEAENERMHLLIWMQVTKPSMLERGLVMVAQGAYVVFYMGLYLISPSASHRLVGYLEEEAHLAYSDYLRALDANEIENRPAPLIAKEYYHLPDNATIRDVVLHVRADECMHRDFNHMLSNKYKNKDLNSRPAFMGGDFRSEGAESMAREGIMTDPYDETKAKSAESEPVKSASSARATKSAAARF
uniref:Alternative oxidase n=1 Tax=Rhodosorus marinus TaxID=101924 RepID=A0A7S0BES9_9RHOD|mmetsp:Transcript_12108/g.17543  ORF Transcript_12108/g.17543 Transcript_12108/m.17543 type:complete len:375 (+) Transcript_12108:126-1250(+)